MSRHQYDLVQCMKQPGRTIGKLCSSCDGKCPMCDSLVKPVTKVRICEECSYGHLGNKCILCGNNLAAGEDDGDLGYPAYYCLECVRTEKDREGCPRIINVGSSKSDMIFKKAAT